MIDKYVKRFAKLRTDKAASRWSKETKYRAPHKPLLLLAVMDLFAQGSITANLIEFTTELGELFTLYWSNVMPPHKRGNLALPFFHLQSDGFWHLVPRPGKEEIVAAASQIRSINRLEETVLGARLDEELYLLLNEAESRDVLRTVLVETYFSPGLQTVLLEQGEINVAAHQYSQELLQRAEAKVLQEEDAEEYQPAVRDQGFRRAIVTVYDHRCAFCGIRILTPDGHTLIEAAHIVPWSINQDDRPNNGLALCRLCHWAFDEGMFAISHRYLVLISRQLKAEYNMPGHLVTIDGRKIIGPEKEALWPDVDALKWHRANVFRR